MTAELTPLLVGLALRAAAVLAFAFGLTLAMRRASASARHVVWTCALAAAALVPATALVTPGWQIESPVRIAAPDVARSTAATAPQADAQAALSTPVGPATRAVASLEPADAALIVWAGGTLAVLFYLFAGTVCVWRLRRKTSASRSVDDVHALAEALKIAQRIEVIDSETATTPMVSGIWRPLIVLPREAAAWPEERRHVVLLHELAHIKRRDCLTQLLAQLVCAAYWFNPLAWMAARRLRMERERACDDFVLAAGTPGSEYASHLLEIAQGAQPGRLSLLAATVVPMARRSQLEGRLMAILDPATRRSSAFYTRFAAAALVALISIPVAAIHLVSPQMPVRNLPPATHSTIEASVAPPAAAPAQAPARAGAAQTPARPTPDDRLRYGLNKSLVEFADEGDADGVVAMLSAGADVNAAIDGDGSPLIAAADEGHVDVVRLLLDRGADPNLVVSGDGTPLIAASGEGHGDVVRLLLERGADPNLVVSDDGTPLIAASEEGHADVVRLLLERGADPNLVASGDGTALIAASGEGHADVVRLLLERGADPNLIAAGDGTALIAAAGDGHVDVMELLIERGAMVNVIAEGDETALIQAAGDGHLAAVKLLVANGADVNLGVWVEGNDWIGNRIVRREPVWRTPLGEARGDGHANVVTFLISAGARD